VASRGTDGVAPRSLILRPPGYDRSEQLVPLGLWPAPDDRAPVVFIVPALGTPARIYAGLALALAASGLHAGVLELRGVGTSPVRAAPGTDWDYADLVHGEVAGALAALREVFPDSPLIALAHSLGGHLMVLHQANAPAIRLDRLILVGSGAPYWPCYPLPRRPTVLAIGWAAAVLPHVFGYFPGQRLGFGGRQAAGLMRQWARYLLRGVLAGACAALPSARLPQGLSVHALAVAGDTFVTPPGIRHLLAEAGVDVQVETAALDGAPGHFAWVKQGQAMAGLVVRSISGRRPA
jgi:predicted alpha/beta hydrolase